jgi:hypothetical protein
MAGVRGLLLVPTCRQFGTVDGAAEAGDEVGECGVAADVSREDHIPKAGEFGFGTESPDGDAGQGLAEDESAADSKAEGRGVAGGDAAFGDQVARGDGEILNQVNQRVGNAPTDGEARRGVG